MRERKGSGKDIFSTHVVTMCTVKAARNARHSVTHPIGYTGPGCGDASDHVTTEVR